MTWIQTRTGIAFDFWDPRPEMVSLEDIAFALSRIVRFNGHVGLYTVAQHSILVQQRVPDRHKRQALLHDATEAYVGDIVAPLKRLLPDFRDIEWNVWLAICKRFDVPPEMASEVKYADLRMLATEKSAFFDTRHPTPREWIPLPDPYPLDEMGWRKKADGTWSCGMHPSQAEKVFLGRAEELGIR